MTSSGRVLDLFPLLLRDGEKRPFHYWACHSQFGLTVSMRKASWIFNPHLLPTLRTVPTSTITTQPCAHYTHPRLTPLQRIAVVTVWLDHQSWPLTAVFLSTWTGRSQLALSYRCPPDPGLVRVRVCDLKSYCLFCFFLFVSISSFCLTTLLRHVKLDYTTHMVLAESCVVPEWANCCWSVHTLMLTSELGFYPENNFLFPLIELQLYQEDWSQQCFLYICHDHPRGQLLHNLIVDLRFDNLLCKKKQKKNKQNKSIQTQWLA